MVDTREEPDESSERAISEGESVGIGQNPPPQQAAVRSEGPTINVTQQEYFQNMKDMFDHFLAATHRNQPTPTPEVKRAPIEKLSLHRAYTFTGNEENGSEAAEHWLEFTTKIVTKQLSCTDEHKLDCAVALLADNALSWWEAVILTVPEEAVTWKFFVEEFNKKYVSEQYRDEMRDKFLYLKQGGKPIEQYINEFCKLCKYGTEFMKTDKDKCKRFRNGLSAELGPFFATSEVEDFQALVNQAISTEAKLKVAERFRGGSSGKGKQQRQDDKPYWKAKKARHSEGYSSKPPLLKGVMIRRGYNQR